MTSEYQMNLFSAVGSEQKEKKNVLFGALSSTAEKYKEREKEGENVTFEILLEIGICKSEQKAAKIIRYKANIYYQINF